MTEVVLDNWDKHAIKEWRGLGFWYDMLDKGDRGEWIFHGSKTGFNNFVKSLNAYVNDPRNKELSEHEHYGPYSYLKVMTWDKPVIAKDYFAGTLPDIERLADLISQKLENSKEGDVFTVDKEYGVENSASATFFIEAEGFDPISLDEQLFSKVKQLGTKD